jgi:hypothetical protein
MQDRNARPEKKDEKPAKERSAPSAPEEMPLAKPVKGVVLEFATRMRQSRGSGALLNNWINAR